MTASVSLPAQVQRARLFAASTALLGWLGLGLELWVLVESRLARGLDVSQGVFIFLGYFTIWTNLLVAIALTAAVLMPRTRFGRYLTQPAAMTGIACNIALVAITYHLLLHGLWHLSGPRLLANNLMHYAVPALFLIFWWLFVAPAGGAWRHPLVWATFPVVYLLFALVRGAATGFYAYPFIDVDALGYAHVLMNAGGILLMYLLISAILLWLDKRKR